MKSKTFFSEFIKQEFKRQLWLMALFGGLFFLIFPVRWLMQLDNKTYHMVYTLKDLQNIFVDQNVSSKIVSASVIFAAVLCSIYHFAYLHSGKQMDFFGSFPIRKEKMFLHKAVFGYVDFAVPYTVMWAMMLILGVTRNLVTGKIFLIFLAEWAVGQIYYLLAYLTAALAMMLTGKIVLGIAGSGILLFFGIFVQTIHSAYMEGFFDTYVTPHKNGKINYLSPVYYGSSLEKHLQEIYWGTRSVTGKEAVLAFLSVAVVVGLYFLNRYLIQKRPAEAAGRSMAFVIPARVIHVVLSVSGALGIGLVVKNMMYNRQVFWVLISVFFGAIFFYILIQFVYTLDFRKVLRYKWQLLVAEMFSMGIACVFCFDLIGYDSYMPDREKTENISLSIQNYYMDSGYTIGDEFVDTEEYRLQNMQIEQHDMVYELIKNIIAEQDDSENGAYQTLMVRYMLKGGRTVNRCYYIDYVEYKEELIRLFDDSNFRKTMYPYLGDLGDEPAEVRLGYADENHELLSKDNVTVEEFLKIYREEMRALPGCTIVEEIPLAYLEIQTKSLRNNFYMFIYPSCKKSLAWLEKLGWQVVPLLTAERVKEITIEDYRSYDEDIELVQAEAEAAIEIKEGEIMTFYTEPEEIEQLLPVLVDSDYTEVWNECRDSIYADATVESPGGYTLTVRCELLAGELPDILKKNNH